MTNTTEKTYNSSEVEAIAKIAAEYALRAFHPPDLDRGIEQIVNAENGEDTMASKHKEKYHFTRDGIMDSCVFYGNSKADTDLKFQHYILSLGQPIQSPQTVSPTLRDFIENTYKPKYMRKLAPMSSATYTQYIDNYIIPVLGDKPANSITVDDIQSFMDWMATKKKLVSKTIDRVIGVLSRLFTIARDMKLVQDSPVKKSLLTNDGGESGHYEPLPDSEVDRIKQAIPLMESEQERLYMGLLVYTGMRREEIAGLTWECIHLDERYGSVRRTVTYPNGRKPVVRDKTKTKHSTRDFVIPDALAAILESASCAGGYVIHGRDQNEPIPHSSLRKLYKSAFDKLKIDKKYCNHNWRATFGTQLKESGMSSAQIADLLGHADTRMVETTYARTRHDGVMKHKNTLNDMNRKYEKFPAGFQKQPDSPYVSTDSATA